MKPLDRSGGMLYYVCNLDSFFRVSCDGEPTPDDYVAVERLATGQVVIERYRGQAYIGVVRWMDYYRLKHSEQSAPKADSNPFPRELAG